ncbi:MAG TPA: leucine-rich repeat domain-containing protein [Verrucomicrobiae bacterium]|jgi:hypothetical protein|nr:leucine-rich repeat domain-containing protein [Verrucomicrobiae bacterium]
MYKTILSVAFLAATVSANAQSLSEFSWITNASRTITITGFSGQDFTVNIPSQINSMAVTAIGAGAFQNNNDFLTLTIPSSVTSIGAGAFENCTSLASLAIPDGVTTIGDYAFSGCGDLGGTITIPSSLTTLGQTVFQGDFFVSAFDVSSGNPDYASSGGVLFNKSMTTLIAFPPYHNPAAYTVPNGITKIAPDAFFGCSGLVTVTNPATLASIGDSAFVGCVGLTGVYFEGNEPKADSSAFVGEHPTAYYYSGAKGWGATFAGLHTVKLNRPVVTAILTVATNGIGSIMPVDNGKALVVGNNYILTASPGRNWLFNGWTATGSENFTSNSPVLKFIMESNLALTANFATNNFVGGHGTYNGLFAPISTSPREQTDSGAITFSVTSAGRVSGKLTTGTNAASWSGQLDASGSNTFVIPRKGLTTVTAALQLDFADQSVSGTITDGSFVAIIDGNRQVFSAGHPANQYKGRYSLVIAGNDNPDLGPSGYGFGNVTVNAAGVITFKGSLADGTSVNQSSFVSKDGYWPLYLPLYKGAGSLYGFCSLSTNGNNFNSSASWINATNASKTALYRSGFTNESVNVNITHYVPAQTLPAVMNIGLMGGNLPMNVVVPVDISSGDVVKPANPADETNKLSMTITKSTGAISGHFVNPANPKETIHFGGVVVQQPLPVIFYGCFLGTTASGALTAEAP